jgi:predicted nucleic acid-binding protein
VARLIFLDSGPLGLACAAPTKPAAQRCQVWMAGLRAAGARIVVPEISDYEIRRELLRMGGAASLRRLDLLALVGFDPITSAAIRHAAVFWAFLRRKGLATAGPQDLDADAILAGQAKAALRSGDTVTIATTNLRHLGRFPTVDAQEWTTIL